MARSAPLASASRMVCDAEAGPAQSAMTSPPFFSFNCSPASSAYASGSLISYVKSDVWIQAPDGSTRNCESRAGTCLIATTIFIEILAFGGTAAACSCDSLLVVALEDQAAIRSAEAERI